MQPNRLSGLGSRARPIAYRHGSVTGGEVIGNFGFALRMTFVKVVSEFPSNGRWKMGVLSKKSGMGFGIGGGVSYLIIYAFVEQHT